MPKQIKRIESHRLSIPWRYARSDSRPSVPSGTVSHRLRFPNKRYDEALR